MERLAGVSLAKQNTEVEQLGEGLNGLNLPLAKINDNIEVTRDKFGEAMESVASAIDKGLEYVNKFGDAIGGVFDVWGQSIQNKEEKANQQCQREQERIESSQMSEKAKEEALQELRIQRDKHERKMARKKAKRDKAQAIFGAVVSTAQAVAKALTAGPILGPILAGIVGAIGAAKISLIASQPLPKLAKGGLAYGETTAIVGDNPNARTDPEVIAPLSKLGKYMMGGKQDLRLSGEFRVQGQDLVLSLERANQIRQRRI